MFQQPRKEQSKNASVPSIENVDKMFELYGTQPLKLFGTNAGDRTFLTPYIPGIDAMKVIGYYSQSL